MTLKILLTEAYDVKPYQVTGPGWLDSERYDVIAKVPPGSSKEQVNAMWRNLLAERFGLMLHHESKEFQTDEMAPAKGGLKLKESTLDPNAAEAPEPEGPPPGAMVATAGGPFPGGPPPPGAPNFDKNGVPRLNRPGLVMMMTIGPNGPMARMVARAQTMAQLASMLGNRLNHPVVDKTGATGKYDFTLEYSPDPGNLPLPPGPPPGSGDTVNAPEPSGLTLVGALQQQLGVRLVATKAKLDILVIDHAEKTPTAN